MPCHSCRSYSDESGALRKIERLEAMLCALVKMTGLDAALEQADWKEAGVGGQELREWWGEHQRKDAARKQAERQRAEQLRVQTEALAKLSPQERAALGLRGK